ncbi:DUF4272 domain-containing protein [Luteolibacter sp. Populi]|uniref:DUF4272 domain-containing protein n=1 Tax=Luteolibacter sp. Populi TaxID=3230487 RepID=UPI0034661896
MLAEIFGSNSGLLAILPMIDPQQVKEDNTALLRSWGFPVNDFLPTLEEEEDLSPPSAVDVARRCVILNHVIGIGFGGDAGELCAAVKQYDLFDAASEHERKLLESATHTQQELIDATWWIECVQSLAWCLGLAELPHLREADEDLASKFPAPYTDPAAFIASAALRPFEEIYREADLHYRLHWATRAARLGGPEVPLGEGLIRERRKALDWVIGVETDWDEVPGDT